MWVVVVDAIRLRIWTRPSKLIIIIWQEWQTRISYWISLSRGGGTAQCTHCALQAPLGVTEWRYPLCPIYCSAVNGAFVLFISSDTFRSSTHRDESWPRKTSFMTCRSLRFLPYGHSWSLEPWRLEALLPKFLDALASLSTAAKNAVLAQIISPEIKLSTESIFYY